jgi:hypothetical protein
MASHYENPVKIAAREHGFRWFLSTGRTVGQYWTLCNYQSDSEQSEINQAVSFGAIPSKTQFNGVDRSASAIAYNAELHPEAAWHTGEWLHTVHSAYRRGIFAPALVYLDTCSLVDCEATATLVAWTMRLCPPGACIIANVMLVNPHSHHKLDAGQFLQRVVNEAGPEANAWQSAARWDYKASATTMGTYCFAKRAA